MFTRFFFHIHKGLSICHNPADRPLIIVYMLSDMCSLGFLSPEANCYLLGGTIKQWNIAQTIFASMFI